VIVVADSGPLLHLHWIGAAEWALPPTTIDVVDVVWREVASYAPEALNVQRLRCVPTPSPIPDRIAAFRLDDGEAGAIAYATRPEVEGTGLLLCDDVRARKACRQLSLAVVGSIGLIVEASRAKRVPIPVAKAALGDLAVKGKLYVGEDLIRRAVESLG
jgi:predicted nucleic acid-binding protein